jgi:uncharacterized protein (UPF0548 family)
MIALRKPSAAAVRSFLARQAERPFSYAAVGASLGGAPPGYVVGHNRVRLGEGEETFRRACEALRRWEMFHLGWVEVQPPVAPVAVGTTVAVLVHLAGLWWLNASRIVYVVEESGTVDRFGFAYGTLPEHAEEGEERFTVERDRRDDAVWYDLYAFSRPRHPLARLGTRWARRVQKRFARDSLAAMARAVGQEP